jgi:DNA polymerase I-like protein with 3'-5' exonuclease and polymerase domains
VVRLEPAGRALIMQVHDELVLECRRSRVAEVAPAVREHMMGAASLRVPCGSTWPRRELGSGH